MYICLFVKLAVTLATGNIHFITLHYNYHHNRHHCRSRHGHHHCHRSVSCCFSNKHYKKNHMQFK